MKLKVNGQSVRVVDRIEIEIDVPEDGDTLLNGMSIIIKGGSLTIEDGDSDKHAALYIQREIHDEGSIKFFINKPPISFMSNNNQGIPIPL